MIRLLLAATTLRGGVGAVCAVYRNASSGLVSFGSIDNATGSIVESMQLANSFDSRDGYGVDASGFFYYLDSSHLGTVNLMRQLSNSVQIQAPAGYVGNFTAQGVNVDVPMAPPLALLVNNASATPWAVIADINQTTGAAVVRADITSQYFNNSLPLRYGISALDSVSGILWTVGQNAVYGDVAIGFALAAPDAPPTIVPFPEQNTVTSLRFGGPQFSGPGLVAVILEPDGKSLTLLGSFLNEGGQPDFFEVQNYNSSVTSAGAGQLALSPDQLTAYVGLLLNGKPFISVMDTESNQEIIEVVAQGYDILGLASC